VKKNYKHFCFGYDFHKISRRRDGEVITNALAAALYFEGRQDYSRGAL